MTRLRPPLLHHSEPPCRPRFGLPDPGPGPISAPCRLRFGFALQFCPMLCVSLHSRYVYVSMPVPISMSTLLRHPPLNSPSDLDGISRTPGSLLLPLVVPAISYPISYAPFYSPAFCLPPATSSPLLPSIYVHGRRVLSQNDGTRLFGYLFLPLPPLVVFLSPAPWELPRVYIYPLRVEFSLLLAVFSLPRFYHPPHPPAAYLPGFFWFIVYGGLVTYLSYLPPPLLCSCTTTISVVV